MKLLFDENLSPKLPGLLKAEFPGSVPVRDVSLQGRDDVPIWKHAQDHGFVVVSKDADFYHRALMGAPPPKLVWLRIGNCTRDLLLSVLVRHRQDIEAFGADAAQAVLILS